MDEAQRLAELIPRIMNSFHDLGRHHPSGEKLSMRQFQTLILLNASQSLTLSQLCDKLGLAPSTGTELVNRMAALEYIQKIHEDADQRQVQLSITPKGLKFMEKRKQALVRIFSQFLSVFSEEERKTFVSCFEQIWTFMKKSAELPREGL